MRALVLDVGNTSVKMGIATESGVPTSFSLPTDTRQSGDLLGLHFMELLRQAEMEIGTEFIEACVVSSVVPGMNPLIRHACKRFLGIQALFAHQDIAVPLENRYEHPTEVGADRLVAAYAARQLFPQHPAVISVDYGTATTFDCVSGNAYLGGLICPGVLSALGALSTRTAQLPRIPLTVDDSALSICRSTVNSLNQGFLFGFAAMSEGLCSRLREILPQPCAVVATGGFAKDVAKVSTSFDTVQSELLLDGLRLLWLEHFHRN